MLAQVTYGLLYSLKDRMGACLPPVFVRASEPPHCVSPED